MSFYYGQLSSSDAAPTTTMVNKIEEVLGQHSAWVFIEAYISGGYETRTWKNKGSANSFGQDFYLHIMRPSDNLGSGYLYFRVSEGYNTSTHLAIRANADASSSSYYGVSTTPDATYNSYYGTTAISPFSGPGYAMAINAQNFANGYFVSVSKNALMLGGYSNTYIQYMGLYEPFFTDMPNEFPLVCHWVGNYGGSNGVPGSFTRAPGYTASNSHFAAGDKAWSSMGGSLNGGNQPGYKNAILASKQALIVSGGYYGSGGGVGVVRGFCYDLVQVNASGSLRVGDTVLTNGKIWHLAKAESPYWLVNTEAA